MTKFNIYNNECLSHATLSGPVGLVLVASVEADYFVRGQATLDFYIRNFWGTDVQVASLNHQYTLSVAEDSGVTVPDPKPGLLAPTSYDLMPGLELRQVVQPAPRPRSHKKRERDPDPKQA